MGYSKSFLLLLVDRRMKPLDLFVSHDFDHTFCHVSLFMVVNLRSETLWQLLALC